MTSLLTRPSSIRSTFAGAVPLRIGVIGYGYWGPNLARNIASHAGTELAAIADLSPKRLAGARAAHPGAWLTADVRELLADPEIDAVVVATPPETHHDLVVRALESGKHVLVEKPLATTIADAEEMVDLARRCGRTLSVDHTFLFTGAVRRMKRYFEAGEVGDVYYYDSTRINLGLFQHQTNVIWDLAPHDISIMLHLIDDPVRSVSAVGARHVDANVENIAYLTLQFEGPMLAHFHVNWLAPTKVRRTIIGGSKKMLVYDDGEASEKLKVYDSGAKLCATDEDIYRTLVEYRTGDVLAPRLEKAEALAVEVAHFENVVRGLEAPLSGGELGLKVVRIIEAAQRSLLSGGHPVEVAA
ncbi:MAG: Gfo/Idh/MocA family oxidoreductase [Chloroflexi bacterium]|nr:Gfo/Idh/MocA family oxidoreductase [Chloroflexota bacterium]